MKSFIRAKSLAAAALALGAFAGVSAAHARSDVYFSVGVQPAPGVYVEPAPVYVQPPPVYVTPRPVYTQPPVYVAPREVYVRPAPPAYGYGYGYDEERARRAEWRHRYWRHHHHDFDGYPNRGRNWD